MNRLTEVLSRTLDPDERDAVLGDFEESGEQGGQQLRDLLGLIARRQAALWKGWQPWLALASLVIPIGILLSRECRHLASGSAIYSWMYLNNWTPTYLENSGFRTDLVRDALTFLLDYLALIFWSWTVGFAVGSLSRRAVWINGTAFCVLMLRETVAVRAAHYGVNAAAFAVGFYRFVLPAMLLTTLVLIPAFLGMSKGTRLIALSPKQMTLWVAVCAGSTFWWDRSLHWGMGMLLPVALAWPVAYMIAATGWKRSHET
jgi:hypothetical protein